MSTTIDTNIVQMKFDNKQFEEGCKESMNTLEKLKQKINDSNSGNALDGLTKSANKVDLSHIDKSVDKIADRFTFLGNLAFKIKDKIADSFLGMAKTLATTVPNIIKEGGWERAMNIEKAKFQLEGLHVAWKDISDDINYAVDGTAYGLDAAATAASQLVASGVQVGDSMKQALRAISGVAAMTQTQYEEIAPIFTTVAGQGKIMTQQLRQLENRGLNAAAIIGQAIGKTEAEVRDMVTHGEIDFATFASAMDNAFGEHAKDANRTFEGVTANIRAALKKIGADFSTPIIQQDGPVVKALQQLRLRINDVRASLGPLNDAWVAFINNYGKLAERLLRQLDMSFMTNIVNGLVNSFNALLSIIRPIGYAFKDIFASDAQSGIKSIAEGFESFTKKLILSRSEMENLRATIRGFLAVLSMPVTILKQILGALLSIKPETVNLREIILNITGTIGNLLTYISLLIKQTNIIQPAIKGISIALKVLIGLIGLGVSKLVEFVNCISKLEITKKVINGLEFAIKALLGGIILLASTVIKFISSTAQKIPEILSKIRTELSYISDLLSNIPIINSAINGIKKLADSFNQLLHPNKSDTKDIEGAITIVDEAVALAGPKKVSILEKFVNTLVKVKNKLAEVGTSVVNFIKNLDYGAIAAVAFTVAIAAIGYKLSKTFQSISDTFTATGKAIQEVGGFIGSMKNRSVMELLFGKKDPPQSHKLLEFAAAILAIGVSFKVMSTIDWNKLKEVGIIFAGFAVGITAVVIALTACQKVLGKGEAIVLSNSLFAIAGSIALMTTALAIATQLDYTNIQKAGLAIAQLALLLTGMSIALAKFAPALSSGALALIGMALSIKILIKSLDLLQKSTVQLHRDAEDYNGIWGKTGYLMVLAGGLVIISGIASRLGTNSLGGIVIALLSVKAIMALADSIAKNWEGSAIKDAWDKLVEFCKGISEKYPKVVAAVIAVLGIAALITTAVIVFKNIKKAVSQIGETAASMQKDVGKMSGLQKALARLSLVPVIIALTGMFIAIGAMYTIIGNIKIKYLGQANKIMLAIGLMFLTLAMVIKSTENSKPGAVIAAMVGITMLFSELIVLTLLVEKHALQMIEATAMMSAVMLSLAAVIYNVSKISEDNKNGLIAIGLVAGIVAELGTILYILSQQDWASMAASGAAMYLAMKGFTDVLEQLGQKGQSFGKEKLKVLLESLLLFPAIGSALAIATLTHDWSAMLAAGYAMKLVLEAYADMVETVGEVEWNDSIWKTIGTIATTAIAVAVALDIATLTHDWSAMLAAGYAMSAVIFTFGKIMGDLAEVEWEDDVWKTIAVIAASAVSIGAGLALATLSHDWTSILAGAASMSLVMAVFGGMMKVISQIDWNEGAWLSIVGISACAVSIGAGLALATLSHDWTSILAGAGAMSAVMVVFSLMAKLLGEMNPTQALTSMIVMLSIAATSVAIGASLAMLAQYPWQEILAAAGIMVGTATLLGVVAAILGAPVIGEFALLGAGVLDLLAAAFAGMAISSAMLLGALTAFLPVATAFLEGVLGILVSYAPQMPAVAEGLLSIAPGLAAIGAAGIVLALGALGLITGSAGIIAVSVGLNMLSAIDISGIGNQLSDFLVPAALLGPIGLLMGAGAPGLFLAAAGMTAFAIALGSLTKVLNTGLLNNLGEFGNTIKNAKNWGSDLVQNFINGIKAKFGELKKAVTDIAQTIKDYIHFTSPDKGPLSDFDSYGPDMLKNFISGALSELPGLESAMGEIGEAIGDPFKDGIDYSAITDSLSDMGIDLNSIMDGNLSDLTGKVGKMKGLFGQMQAYNSANFDFMGDASLPTDVKRQMQEAELKKVAEAADDASDSLDNYTEATKKAGGSSKKAAENTKDLTDAFKAVEKGAKVNLNNMINNLAANYKETASWAQDMKTLMGKGFDKSITDWIKKMGVGGHETVKAFMNASEEQVVMLNTAMKKYLTLDEDAENYILGKYDEFGAQIVEVLSGAVETYDGKLAETIQSAVDPFAEFEKKEDLTGAKLLSNMQSQLDGISKWGENLQYLMDKNGSGALDGIIQHFAELGPKSYEELNAMTQLTDEQLEQAGELWNAQLEIGRTVAIQIAQKYKEVGENVSQGLTDGIDFDQANADGLQIATELLDGTTSSKGLDTHSPSRKFFKIGENIIQGLKNAIGVNKHIPVNLLIIMANECVKQTEANMGYAKGKEIGEHLTNGIKKGIEDGQSKVIQAAVDTATAAYEAAKRALDINSPSKLFRKLGLLIDEGWAQGIDRGTGMVVDSTESVADNMLQMMNEIIANIADDINESPEFSPVIRPRLDLTEFQNGKARMNSMFGNPAFEMASNISASRNDAAINPTSTPQTSNTQNIIFNQTNNSPKALDTYTIYRQSRNLMEMMKGATT